MTIGELRNELADLPDGAAVTVQADGGARAVLVIRWSRRGKQFATWADVPREQAGAPAGFPEVGEGERGRIR